MVSDVKEQLATLIKNIDVYDCDECQKCSSFKYGLPCDDECFSRKVADYLISNGVVPVVRCKDCDKSKPSNMCGAGWCFCHNNFQHHKEDHFCGYGERRKTMIEYNKIDTIYNRQVDGSKKLIEGDFRNDTVEFLKDLTWQFTEKIDGTNIRVMWDGHKVSYGGRTERSAIPAHLMTKLLELFGGDETEQLFEQVFGEREVILFGEGYGVKIQNGGLYRQDVSFILFDVMINGNYQSREMVERTAEEFGLEVVPVIFEGTLEEGVAYVKGKPMSTIGKAPMEGLVARPKFELRDRCGNRMIVKIRVKDFA